MALHIVRDVMRQGLRVDCLRFPLMNLLRLSNRQDTVL
jgi:hypothetical protein